MTLNAQFALWAPFVIASLLTSITYTALWEIGRYWALLSLLGVLSGALAARILARANSSRWSVSFVVLGLILGQWWFIEFVTMQLLWSIRGFGP